MKATPWIVAGLVVLGAGTAYLETHRTSPSPEGSYVLPVALRRPAPDFALPDYRTGKMIRLSAYRGKVVLVNFWATWCPPCRHEIPDFIRTQARLRSRGFEILGLSLDEGGAEAVAPFAQRIGINYEVVLGNQEVASLYGGIRGIPTSFLIDRKGHIARVFPGMLEPATLDHAIAALLGERSARS